MGVPLTSYAHSVAPTECAYAVSIMVVRSLRYRQAMKSYASLTAAQTEAWQSLYMSGSGAALACEALGLTSMMAWLG